MPKGCQPTSPLLCYEANAMRALAKVRKDECLPLSVISLTQVTFPGRRETLPLPGTNCKHIMKEWPLWEVFIRSKQGLSHKHVGSLHAADAAMAIENARDVYCRRNEGISIWVVESKYIHASTEDQEAFFDPSNDKVYRHPTFYKLPDEVKHM